MKLKVLRKPAPTQPSLFKTRKERDVQPAAQGHHPYSLNQEPEESWAVEWWRNGKQLDRYFDVSLKRAEQTAEQLRTKYKTGVAVIRYSIWRIEAIK